MTQKSFKFIKIITAFFLGLIMSQAVIFNNYILAVAAVISAVALVFISRRRVKEVMADERDYAIAGKSARLSLSIFSFLGAAATFVFMSFRQVDFVYEVIGSVLAYSVCALLLLYSAIFTFYEKQN